MVKADAKWMPRSEIASIEGALKASAYVARAYNHAKTHRGKLPPWADKLPNGRWVFDRTYILADAKNNRLTIGVSEAARMVGATRRAVQTWIDEGIIETYEQTQRTRGEPRRILREPFERALPRLRKRLETAAVVGYKKKHGIAVPDEVTRRVEAEREKKREAKQRQHRKKRKRQKDRDQERRKATLKAELSATQNAHRELEEKRQKAELDADLKRNVEEQAIATEKELRRRLREAERAAKRATQERKAAVQAAARTAQEERRTAASERGLAAGLARLVQDARRRRAEAVEARLEAARDEHRKEAEKQARTTPSKDSREKKSKSAAAAAAKFESARLERHAISVAERIANDMFDDRINRHEAVVIFNEIAEREGIPDSVKVKVRKQYFGR